MLQTHSITLLSLPKTQNLHIKLIGAKALESKSLTKTRGNFYFNVIRKFKKKIK